VSGGGSLWQVNGGLTVGNADSGSLSVISKGAVVLDSLDAGALSAGNGQITVTGAGSKLSVSGNAIFGDQGNGTLTLQSGALGHARQRGLSQREKCAWDSDPDRRGHDAERRGDHDPWWELVRRCFTLGKGTTLNITNLNIGPGGVLNSFGGSIGGYSATVGPALTAGLVTFGSGTATNGTTADPTVSGTVSAANTLVSLAAGLGTAAQSSYRDITGTISGGAFTDHPAQLTALNGGSLPGMVPVVTSRRRHGTLQPMLARSNPVSCGRAIGTPVWDTQIRGQVSTYRPSGSEPPFSAVSCAGVIVNAPP